MAFTLPPRFFTKHQPVAEQPASSIQHPVSSIQHPASGIQLEQDLERELEQEFHRLKIERNKLSSGIAPLVDIIRSELAAKDPGLAARFMQGEVKDPRLRKLRSQLNELQGQLTALYDKREHLKKYGKLPEVERPTRGIQLLRISDPDIMQMRHTIRRLDDLIYKTTKAIKSKPNAKSDRVLMWKEKVALAEAEREALKHKLKAREDESRTQNDRQHE